jgi:diguanylate cyclase (GGDEF)-like protein
MTRRGTLGTGGRLRWRRGRVSLVLSILLVLAMAAVGVLAGQRAASEAREVHRQDRLELQQVLSQLTGGATLVLASQLQSVLEDLPPWSPDLGDPETSARLAGIVTATKTFDAGAVLLDSSARPLGQHAARGTLPTADDPGWTPLRSAVARADGTVPVSDVLTTGHEPMLAIGLPVDLVDGTTGLVLGFWSVRDSQLQSLTEPLDYDDGYLGLVVDGNQVVVASTHPETLGRQMPFPALRSALRGPGASGVLDVVEDGEDRVAMYAEIPTLGWTGLGTQDTASFEGAMVRNSRLAQGALVALLLTAGGALVLMHRKREAALEQVALRDELTGLYNRRGWMVLADHELDRARRQGTSRVLLFVDLDGLKQVNDVLGHREGDRAIAAAADVLRSASRSSDLVGRLGGDEFVLLVAEQDHADGARQRLLTALEVWNSRSGAQFELRLSVGAEVWFPDAALTLDELVRRADAEMYAEKSARPRRSEGVVRTAPIDAELTVPSA